MNLYNYIFNIGILQYDHDLFYGYKIWYSIQQTASHESPIMWNLLFSESNIISKYF
jgi:hypothetical protein